MLNKPLASSQDEPHSLQSIAVDVAANQSLEVSPQSAMAQLCSVLIGKDEKVKLSVACLLAGGHLLIEDIPGVGKTTLAQSLGMTLGLEWTRLQFTSDLLPADVVGVSIFNSKSGEFEFKPGPVFTSVLLADEINRAPPKAQSALLEAMEEKQISIDGTTYKLNKPFFVIATQNPADNMGAYPLPESQLDRFLAGVELGYPDPKTEKALLAGGDQRTRMNTLSAIADAESLLNWQATAQAVNVSEPVLDYVQSLLTESRKTEYTHKGMRGLSPRAGLNLLAMARAWAMLENRKMVLPDDVQAVFPSVAGHRMTGNVKSGHIEASQLLANVPLNSGK